MEKKKLKLGLKKETIEILNQSEMSSLYGGENTGGTLCNTVWGCDPTYDNCYVTVECGGGSLERCGGGHILPYVPGTQVCIKLSIDCYNPVSLKNCGEGTGFCMALTKNCIESIDYCVSIIEK